MVASCSVCSKSGQRNFHFGAITCGACAAFFRRANAEQKRYSCRKGNSCAVKKGKHNICRACRLKKCFDVGMFIENKHAQPLQEQQNIQEPSNLHLNITHSDPSTSQTVDISNNYPLLHKLVTGVRTFLASLKSVATIENKKIKFPEREYTLITKAEYDVMEKHLCILAHTMLNDYFEPFNELIQEHKINIIKMFVVKFDTIIKCYLTSINFPSLEDSRWMTHYGYIIDIANCGHFLTNREHIQLTESVLTHSKKVSYAFYKNGINDIDVAALTYIVYSLESKRLELTVEKVDRIKDELFKEFSHYYTTLLGPEQGIVKYSNVLYLVDNIMSRYNHYHESFVIGKILVPSLLYVWEDMF